MKHKITLLLAFFLFSSNAIADSQFGIRCAIYDDDRNYQQLIIHSSSFKMPRGSRTEVSIADEYKWAPYIIQTSQLKRQRLRNSKKKTTILMDSKDNLNWNIVVSVKDQPSKSGWCRKGFYDIDNLKSSYKEQKEKEKPTQIFDETNKPDDFETTSTRDGAEKSDLIKTPIKLIKPEAPTTSSSQTTVSMLNPLHINKYGPFLHIPIMENSIFFIGEIDQGDEKNLRKAIRKHNIDTIVLMSPGGLIYEGLELANLIYDRGLRTYIPKGEYCASACSFMFFAGKPRIAHGQLGVHQFYSSVLNEAQIVEEGTQYTVSSIIENLEVFDTPAFIYSKMFASKNMYYFSENEKRSFTSFDKVDKDLSKQVLETLKYLNAFVNDNLDHVMLNEMPILTKQKLIQLQLVKLGCLNEVDLSIGFDNSISLAKKTTEVINQDSTFSNIYYALNNLEKGVCY